MNVDYNTLEKAEKLLKELRKLQNASAIFSTYAYEVSATIHSRGNQMKYPHADTVTIPVSKIIAKAIFAEIDERIFEIKKELETL